ncbi:MAG: hypothetical protein KDA96_11800, partial [Planctomycetaceae bacterium]|nr:hypothetical protein [Planctomycetaceae bacterium]
RESGRLLVTTDSTLTTVIRSQAGVRQVEAAVGKGGDPGAAQAWEFSGTTGRLMLQVKPVEPRLLVQQNNRVVFRDDELRLISSLNYTIERAGVFQLQIQFPESLTIDTVRADGMRESTTDKESGVITLSLAKKETGSLTIEITAHQKFDANAENLETELPTLTPLNVERDTGRITVYAPRFLDLSTIDEKLVGLFPGEEKDVRAVGPAVQVSTWNYTQRPVGAFVRTSPRPAQVSASVATTARVEPEVVKVNSIVNFEIQNAGINTLRIAVPEAVANDVRFEAVQSMHSIQQRSRADAVDGWVTWTLVLPSEVTGTVPIAVDWEQKPAASTENTSTETAASTDSPDNTAEAGETAAAEVDRTFELQPPRVLPPFDESQAERRKVTLTQVRGEIRLLRDESLSVSADHQGDTTEVVDPRELELMEAQGDLAFRYYSQPASATFRIQKHEIHEVVGTVISRAAIEIVTERQSLASYYCRFRMTTSERQRLLIKIPVNADLQAPLLNGTATTVEKTTGTVGEGLDGYYVNISREGESDEEFLLTLQFRCPIVEADSRPYKGSGGRQVVRLPTVGEADQGTVAQQTLVAIWAPRDVSFVGEPDRFHRIGDARLNVWAPTRSGNWEEAHSYVDSWVSDSAGGTFDPQGHVAVFRAVGRQSEIVVGWYSTPFLFWVVSGTIVAIGLVLRRTSWENRITMVLLSIFVVVMWGLKDSYTAMQCVGTAVPGLVVVGLVWILGLVTRTGTNPAGGRGSANGPAAPKGNAGGSGPPKSSQPAPKPAASPRPPAPPKPAAPQQPPEPAKPVAPMTTGSATVGKSPGNSLPPGTVTPAPEVRQIMDDLLGGKKR